MKESEKIKITEKDLSQHAKEIGEHSKDQWELWKKAVIYFLMAAVCAVCIYLIFKPKANDAIVAEAGFNAAIPEAKADQLQSDKQKAYEQQLLEQKNEENRNTVRSLSDYWNDQDPEAGNSIVSSSVSMSGLQPTDQNAVNSYRNAQQNLNSFYGRDDQEVNNLRREVSRLRAEAKENNSIPASPGMRDQLELMEKSYRWLPNIFQRIQKRKNQHQLKRTKNLLKRRSN